MSNRSISQRLHEQLTQIIAATAPGQRLLSEPLLAKQLGVSRATLREAMRAFETQGKLRRRQGSGTYVSHPVHVIESGLELLESLQTLAGRIGLSITPSNIFIEERLPQGEESQALGIKEPVLCIRRVMQAEGRQVAYLVDTVPATILRQSDIPEDFDGSVLDLLMKLPGLQLQYSRTEINADTASPEVARAMGIQRRDVLLRMVAYLYDASGKVIDYSVSYFLPGYFRFHVVRRIGQ